MVEGSTQEWFLEIDGRRTGPFDTEQVIGLLQDGEIPEITQVYASTTTTEFLTARELADREQNAQHVPQVEDDLTPPDAVDPDEPELTHEPALIHPSDSEPEPSRAFIPPPRPSEFHPNPDSARQPPTAKPELGLVDALLAAKERKNNNTRAMPPEVARRRPNPFQLQNIPSKAWAILGTAVVLFVAVWGMTHFIKQRASIATSPAAGDSKTTALAVPPPASPTKNTGSDIVSTSPAAGAPPAPPVVGSVPPPANPAAAMPPTLGAQHDADVEREREQNAEREKEREREIANNDAASQGVPPAPPPLEMPGNQNSPPMPGAMVPGMGPGGVPPPPPPLPDTPEKSGNPFPAAGMENPPPPAPPPIE